MNNVASIIITGGFILLVLFAALLYNVYILKRKELEAVVQAQTYQENLRKSILATEQQEREQIAALIHDSFSAKLALLHLQLQKESAMIEKSRFQQLLTEIESLQAESKNFTHQLFPIQASQQGLGEALQTRLHHLQKTHPCVFRLQLEGEASYPVGQPFKNQLYFIIQEAIHNIIKHSEGGTAFLHIVFSPAQVRIEIEHRGATRPKDSNAPAGLGMLLMEKRVKLLAGHMHFEYNAFGSILQVEIPYLNEAI